MTEFAAACKGFGVLVHARGQRVFEGSLREVKRSVIDGSEITGALGQPVASGEIRDSWAERREGPGVAVFATSHPAARSIEDNTRNAHFKNHGAHSVKMTVAGWTRIVALENAAAKRGGA